MVAPANAADPTNSAAATPAAITDHLLTGRRSLDADDGLVGRLSVVRLVVFGCGVGVLVVAVRRVWIDVRSFGFCDVGVDGRRVSRRAIGRLFGQITCCRLLIFHLLPSR